MKMKQYKGKNVGFSAKTVEQDFIDTFGEPYWRDQDDYEIILFFTNSKGISSGTWSSPLERPLRPSLY